MPVKNPTSYIDVKADVVKVEYSKMMYVFKFEKPY